MSRSSDVDELARYAAVLDVTALEGAHGGEAHMMYGRDSGPAVSAGMRRIAGAVHDRRRRKRMEILALLYWLLHTLLGALLAVLPAQAQSFGGGQLRVISPYLPGGGTDTLGRIIAQRYTERFGQPAIVENRPGANGTIGAAFVAKATGDGLTVLIVPAGYAANPSLYKSLPYDQWRDFAPVSLLASGPLVLIISPTLPVRSVKELIALARARPGDLNFGTPGSGALPHLSAELFATMARIKMTHVSYKGPSAAVADLMSGQVQVYFMNVIQSIPLVAAKKLRALGVTSPQRSPIAPDIPTIAESGLKGYDMTNWYGLLVPATTPREVIATMNAEINKILLLPDMRSRVAAMGMAIEATSAEQFDQFLKKEAAKYLRVIEAAGIRGTL